LNIGFFSIPGHCLSGTLAGFEIQKEENTSGSVADLERIQLAPEFKKYSRENLLVLSSWLAATPV
jgi:hypothetical protein